MAGLKRDANIFKVLSTMQDAWGAVVSTDVSEMAIEEREAWRSEQARFVFEGSDVRKTFLTEFESYLFSCEWTKSDVVREIVGYIKSGVPLGAIGDRVGLKNSAFRMRMSRMTVAINDLLFGGETCPEGIYSLTDVVAIKKALLRLRLVRDPIDLHDEFSLRELNWVKGHIEGAEPFVADRTSMDSYFKAVLYLALVSRSFVLDRLDEIDPSALGYAFKDMQADGVNSTKLLFSLLLKHLSADSIACERELALAKKEYQEYMKG